MSSMKTLPTGNGTDGHSPGLPIIGLAFSFHGDLLLSTPNDRTLCLWSVPANLAQAMRRSTKQCAHRSNCVASDPQPGSARFAAGQSNGAVQFWNVNDALDLAVSFDAHVGETLHIKFSSNGRRSASSGDDNRVVVWDSETTSRIWEVAMNATPDGIEFSTTPPGAGDSQVLAVCSAGKLTLFDAETGSEIDARTSGSPIRTVAFQSYSYGGHMVCGHESGEITVEKPTGNSVQSINVSPWARWLGFDPAGRYLGIASSASSVQPIVLQRRPAEHVPFGSPNLQYTGAFSGSPSAFSFSRSQHRLGTGAADGRIWVWPP